MTRIADIGTACKLQTLNLRYSANFNADQTVERLADILQLAPLLNKCNIGTNKSSRAVKVEIQYAGNEGIGFIVLKGGLNSAEICQRETTKTEAT